MKRRITREKEEKVQKNSDGIEHSHGKTWFRGRMIGHGGHGSVYLADTFGFASQMAVKSAQMAHSSTIQRERRALFVLNGCHKISLEVKGEG